MDDQANDPEPLELFNAMQTKMQLIAVEFMKVAKAALKEGLVDRAAQETAATAQATSIADDLQDIIKRLMREDNKGMLEKWSESIARRLRLPQTNRSIGAALHSPLLKL